MTKLLRLIRRIAKVGLILAALTVLSGFLYETAMRENNHRAFPVVVSYAQSVGMPTPSVGVPTMFGSPDSK